jgi:hypothetical protein
MPRHFILLLIELLTRSSSSSSSSRASYSSLTLLHSMLLCEHFSLPLQLLLQGLDAGHAAHATRLSDATGLDDATAAAARG